MLIPKTYSCGICKTQPDQISHHKTHILTQKHKDKYELFLKGDDFFQRSNYTCRIFKSDILREQNNCCIICGCKDEWNGNELVFILDHVDGDASNNKRDNLRLVCPNCDSQLPTYKSKNKKSSRIYRYK